MRKPFKIIITTTLFFVIFGFQNQAKAVGNPQLCSDPSKGCIYCHLSDFGTCISGRATGDTASAGNNCATGYSPNTGASGGDIDGYCLSLGCSGVVEVSCKSDQVERGGFYCKVATDGTKSCAPCDTIAGNAIEDCAGGNPQFPDQGVCTQSCLNTQVNSCTNNQGSRKTACGANDVELNGLTCGVSGYRCCLPKELQGAPGTGTTQTTSANVQGSCAPDHIETAIGCIPIGDVNSFAGFFLRWGLGFAGGIGFLFLIYASFQIMTSQGDPKRLQSGRELLVSALSGILMLIFSVFILRILGVNILGLF